MEQLGSAEPGSVLLPITTANNHTGTPFQNTQHRQDWITDFFSICICRKMGKWDHMPLKNGSMVQLPILETLTNLLFFFFNINYCSKVWGW